jgi:hypothetical protein
MSALVPVTETERYFFGEIAPHMRPGERIETCAYVDPTLEGPDGWGPACFIALTSERMVLVTTRIGAFGPLRENKGVISVDRTKIVGAGLIGERTIFGAGVLLTLDLGGGRALRFRATRGTRHVSSQSDFLDRVAALWPRTAVVEAEGRRVRSERRWDLLVMSITASALVAMIAYCLA